MLTSFVRAIALAVLLFAPTADAGAPTAAGVNAERGQEDRGCCKRCHKGKACGDSCISRKEVCRKPPGCACDGDGA